MANKVSFTTLPPKFLPFSEDYKLPSMPPLQALLSYLLPLIPTYLVLIRIFRRYYLRQVSSQHPYSSFPNASQKPLSEMPLASAHDVFMMTSRKDFPYVYVLGLQFALVRVYAIPSISQLLVKTGQLTNNCRKTVGKRYGDTTVIVSEFYDHPPGSTRSSEALARLNHLHGYYIRQGKISNDDMLYTLSMFMRSPTEWINRYEWRQLSELEIAATGLIHRFIGEAMDISFDALDDYPPPSLSTNPKSPVSTTTGAPRTYRSDGLAFFHSLAAWSLAYETRTMIPAQNNHELTEKTLSLLTTTLPPMLRPIVRNAFISLMDDRMRIACLLPSPDPLYRRSIDTFLRIRAFLTLHFALPRRSLWGWWKPEKDFDLSTHDPHPKSGRRHLKEYDALPHYIKPTLWNRWLSVGAWLSLWLGTPRPGDPGLEGEGWLMREVGPKTFLGKGDKQVEEGRGGWRGGLRW